MDGIGNVWVLLENRITVMTVNNQPFPDDDGIDNFTIVDDVLFKLFQLFKSQRWDFTLKFWVDFKRSQLHHQNALSSYKWPWDYWAGCNSQTQSESGSKCRVL